MVFLKHLSTKRLIVLLSLVAALLIGIAWYLVGFIEEKRVRAQAMSELTRYGERLIGRQLLSIEQVLESLASNRDIKLLMAGKGGSAAAIEHYLNGVAAGSGTSIAYVMDRAGTVIGCSIYGDGKSLVGKNYSFRHYFREAMKGSNVLFPAVGVTTNKRGLYFSTPVYIDSSWEKPSGVVVLKMGVEDFEATLKSMDYTSGMVSPAGVVFVSNNQEMRFKITTRLESLVLEQIKKTRQFGNNDLVPLMENDQAITGATEPVRLLREEVPLIFPGWRLFQWRPLQFPVEQALIVSFIILAGMVFLGLLLIGRRERAEKDLELSYAREEAANNLRQGYENLKKILSACPVSVFLCDGELKVNWTNRTALNSIQFTHYDQAKVYSFGQKLDIRDESGSSLALAKVGETLENIEGTLIRDDCVEVPVLFSRTYFRKEKEEFVLITLLDLSERKQMEAELVHTRKMESIGQLAAGIAHEINSPAQFAGSNLDFIIETLPELFDLIKWLEKALGEIPETLQANDNIKQVIAEFEKLKEEMDLDYLVEELPLAASQSKEGVDRIAKIVMAMKVFSHPGDGQNKMAADINEAIQTTVTVAANEWKSVADIKFELAEDLPMVECLIGELNQVFLNLIVNAAHAVKDRQEGEKEFQKGEIEITTECDKDYVVLKVRDTGTGVPESIQDKLFDPFFTTKDVGQGSGQGLYIANAVIKEQHGGELSFETEIGVGTVFKVRLPVKSHGQ